MATSVTPPAALLAKTTVGSRHVAELIQWLREDGQAEVLTNATLTAVILENGVERAVDGALTVTNGTEGYFTWAKGANDVAKAGNFNVKFTATFDDGLSVITFWTDWKVEL